MQWSPDRNAGFSKTNPQRLYLPVIIDPEYHYEALNVESQQNNQHSLLWWMKRMIALRERYRAFGRGSLEFLFPENRKVLAFLRRYEDETILVVANLSRFSQYVELDLSPFRGTTPVELYGGTDFPKIGDLPYLLTLGPYGFQWFSLEQPRVPAIPGEPGAAALPVLELDGAWDTLFTERGRGALEEVLPQPSRSPGRLAPGPHPRDLPPKDQMRPRRRRREAATSLWFTSSTRRATRRPTCSLWPRCFRGRDRRRNRPVTPR
jgi:maltose alpha-D-glucosyltransferase / alpha-amylase